MICLALGFVSVLKLSDDAAADQNMITAAAAAVVVVKDVAEESLAKGLKLEGLTYYVVYTSCALQLVFVCIGV
jgi:hypothetical protein